MKMMSTDDQIENNEQQMRVFLTADKQVVDLNCCFLQEMGEEYRCQKDLDGAELITCEDCYSFTVFIKRRRKEKRTVNIESR